MKKRVHLVSANSNNPYGMEHFVKRAFEQIGWTVVSTDYRVMSKELVETRIKAITDVDFLLTIKGERVRPEAIWLAKVPRVLWMQDSVRVNTDAANVIQHRSWAYDIVLCFDKAEVPLYLPHKREGTITGYLPLAADPEIHKYTPTTEDIDLGFVGSLTGERVKMLKFLAEHFPVRYGCTREKYTELINRTKINLNLGVMHSGNQQRVFEVLSMGGFLLTNQIPEDGKLFEDKVHLAYYTDDIIDKIVHYSKEDKERRRIAECGRKYILGNHTYVHRVLDIIKLCRS